MGLAQSAALAEGGVVEVVGLDADGSRDVVADQFEPGQLLLRESPSDSGRGVPPLCFLRRRSRCASRALFVRDQRRDAAATLSRYQRKETERFKCFSYDDLVKRDKVNLDIFWLKDESLEDSANLPAPDIIAAEIVEDLEAALEQFAEIATDLSPKDSGA